MGLPKTILKYPQLKNNMASQRLKIDFSDIRKMEEGVRKAVEDSNEYTQVGLLQAITLIQREAVNNTRAGVKYIDGIYETGNLRRSITFEVKPNQASAFISKGLDYPKFVEFGTSRMRAKPFLHIALKENIKKIDEIFDKIIKKQIKRMQV